MHVMTGKKPPKRPQSILALTNKLIKEWEAATGSYIRHLEKENRRLTILLASARKEDDSSLYSIHILLDNGEGENEEHFVGVFKGQRRAADVQSLVLSENSHVSERDILVDKLDKSFDKTIDGDTLYEVQSDESNHSYVTAYRSCGLFLSEEEAKENARKCGNAHITLITVGEINETLKLA